MRMHTPYSIVRPLAWAFALLFSVTVWGIIAIAVAVALGGCGDVTAPPDPYSGKAVQALFTGDGKGAVEVQTYIGSTWTNFEVHGVPTYLTFANLSSGMRVQFKVRMSYGTVQYRFTSNGVTFSSGELKNNEEVTFEVTIP